jgi:hypothetical protein
MSWDDIFKVGFVLGGAGVLNVLYATATLLRAKAQWHRVAAAMMVGEEAAEELGDEE